MKEYIVTFLANNSPYFFVVFFLIILFVFLQLVVPNVKVLSELMFFVVLLTVMPVVIQVLQKISKIIELLASMYIAIIPIISGILLMLQGPLSLLAWHPIVLVLVQLIFFVTNQLLLPAITIAILLDVWSRGIPDIPFTKMAEFIRGSLLIVCSITMLVLTTIMAVASAVIFTVNDAITTPIKRTLEQSVPIVGSIIVQVLSVIKKTQVATTSIVGAGTVITFVSTLSIPLFYVLFHAILFRLLAVFSEPFLPTNITSLLEDMSKSLFIICGITAIIFVGVVILLVLVISLSYFIGGKA